MGNSVERGTILERRERAIASLADSTSISVEEIRNVFARELARLEPTAKYRAHLEILVASNVRTILRHKRA
jgi:hypothetical protein